ncbi:MAG: hypothetical protein VCC00_11790 [Deltaproteobacteria bacterium]
MKPSGRRPCGVPAAGESAAPGFTLVELLVALGLGLSVLALLSSVLVLHLRLARQVQAEARMVGDLAWAMRVVSADLRDAGLDPSLAGHAAFASAGPRGFVRLADRNGDGQIDERSEEMVGMVQNAGSSLLRRVGRQGMSVLQGLPDDGFRTIFFDAEGAVLGTEGIALSAAQRQQVARVRFEVEVAREAQSLRGRFRLQTTTALRTRLAR